MSSQGGESPNPNSNPIGGNNNYPTLVPTPVRASRPPLLATPPGYYGISACITFYLKKNLSNVNLLNHELLHFYFFALLFDK